LILKLVITTEIGTSNSVSMDYKNLTLIFNIKYYKNIFDIFHRNFLFIDAFKGNNFDDK